MSLSKIDLPSISGLGYGFKNRIINGGMVIDQRNAGASVTPTASAYTVDRWQYGCDAASKMSVQQNAGAISPPAGFKNYLGVTTVSAYTPATSDNFILRQRIEGFNTADLGWGSASAATVTLSFWVCSSLTGTFGGALAGGQTYVFSYVINAANTWEYKTITVVGSTSGTWNTDNTSGIDVRFGLGNGATVSGAAGSWGSTAYYNVTGGTQVVGTNGATFYITGAQLEKGIVATSFDWRPYGTELALCQRYFARFNSLGAAYRGVGAGVSESATSISCVVKYPVAMRSGPTASGANMATYDGSSVRAITAFSTQYSGSDAMNINLTVGGGGMTTNRPANLITDNSGTGYFDLSAEL
jgi:hypothetical protein